MEPLDMLGMRKRGELPFEDALLTIAICAAESDKKADFSYIPGLVALALAEPLLSENIEGLRKRIYHLVNAMTVGDQEKFLELAIRSLPLELKEKAFSWAAETAIENGILADEKKQFFEELTAKLSIDTAVAERIIDVSAMKIKNLEKGNKADEKRAYQHEENAA